MTEPSPPVEIDAGSVLRAVTFTANGQYLVGGSDKVQVWRLEDRKQTATLRGESVPCLTVSKDDKWIAAGTWSGYIVVWDAQTYEPVFERKVDIWNIYGVDFSPDSTRLVAASGSRTATVWDIVHCDRQAQVLPHENWVIAAKYSSEGDRIATATPYDIRVWDSDVGQVLVSIKVNVTPSYNTGLLWFNNHLFVLSDNTIKQFDAGNGSQISAWPVQDSNGILSYIGLPKYGQSIAHSTKRSVTFWDMATQRPLDAIQHDHDIHSVSFSPDSRFLAICGENGEISVKSLSRITDSIPLSRLHRTFQGPDVPIDDAALDSWRRGQFDYAEKLLTPDSPNTSSHVLASRAIVRARLKKWNEALADAENAMKLQPSVIAYIAKSVVYALKGERNAAYRACDIAFECFHSSHVSFLLLVKAIVVFIAGEHPDAISRVDDLINTVHHNSICYVVQSYMYLLVGQSHVENGKYEDAIQSFEAARAQVRHHTSEALSAIGLIFGWKFDDLYIAIREHLCEALYRVDRIKEAVERFHQVTSDMGERTQLQDEHLKWVDGFTCRSLKALGHLGDAAALAEQHDVAISHYSSALSLKPSSPQRFFIERSRAFVAVGSLKEALDDAEQVITLDSSSPWGYERKHAALHKAGDYDKAIDAFEDMLSKIRHSPHRSIQLHRTQYVSPSKTRKKIRKIVERTINRLPRVLINTTTGRLYDRADHVSAFEAEATFKELVSSMTTGINKRQIKRQVRHYFRYVTFSHKWEKGEPSFKEVVQITVYQLDASSKGHDKLQVFCKIVRDAGYNWAWSDTCCIDQSSPSVLQEALVAMFAWYQGSARTIVFLLGVPSSAQCGALAKSIWNTRGWTLQEYIASKVIHFYTEDWTPYLDLQLSNHKESQEVMTEMEEATGVSAKQLKALQPGFSSIREKLRLASSRKTERVEDAAYSLMGIFSITGMSTIYGEGEDSLGRLLAHVLTVSQDESILAWSGRSGKFNSCLPTHITVFKGPETSHLPLPLTDAEVEEAIPASDTSFDLDMALKLYGRLKELSPSFTERRLSLPCIVFQLPQFSRRRVNVYRVKTDPFGTVDVETKLDLSLIKSLYLVHPWFDAILDRERTHNTFLGGVATSSSSPYPDDEEIYHEGPDDRVGSDEDSDEGMSIGGIDNEEQSEDVEVDEEMVDEVSDDDEETSDEETDGDRLSASEPDLEPRSPRYPAPVDDETRARRLAAHLR